jgi:hypothetical protein
MLTDKQCKNAICPPGKKLARITNAHGLYMEVSPGGSRRWSWKTYTDGKESRLALGSYPCMGLADARKARDAAKLQKATGVDPVQARKLDKLKGKRDGGDTFKAVALEWHGKHIDRWSPGHADRTKRQLERDLFPWLGARDMRSIEPLELLAVLQKVERHGAVETADRGLMLARQVYEYWLPTADTAQRNITEGLQKRLTPYRGKNFRAIVDPLRFGELLRATYAYRGGPVVRTGFAVGADPVSDGAGQVQKRQGPHRQRPFCRHVRALPFRCRFLQRRQRLGKKRGGEERAGQQEAHLDRCAVKVKNQKPPDSFVSLLAEIADRMLRLQILGCCHIWSTRVHTVNTT